jgi:hypothetical protein
VDRSGRGLKEVIPQNFAGWLEKKKIVETVGVVVEI